MGSIDNFESLVGFIDQRALKLLRQVSTEFSYVHLQIGEVHDGNGLPATRGKPCGNCRRNATEILSEGGLH